MQLERSLGHAHFSVYMRAYRPQAIVGIGLYFVSVLSATVSASYIALPEICYPQVHARGVELATKPTHEQESARSAFYCARAGFVRLLSSFVCVRVSACMCTAGVPFLVRHCVYMFNACVPLRMRPMLVQCVLLCVRYYLQFFSLCVCVYVIVYVFILACC